MNTSALRKSIFTIGHSNRTLDEFLSLLRASEVTAVADVRSVPYSKYCPHFRSEELKEFLSRNDVAYVYMGHQLGGRPADRAFYSDGKVDYEKVRESQAFLEGIARVLSGMDSYRIALMCAEREPLQCHRCLLVGRYLHEHSVDVRHIVDSSETASQGEVEQHLLRMHGFDGSDLFSSKQDMLAIAYKLHTGGSVRPLKQT
jgi:uncharacterized protein (DUF488 family)